MLVVYRDLDLVRFMWQLHRDLKHASILILLLLLEVAVDVVVAVGVVDRKILGLTIGSDT